MAQHYETDAEMHARFAREREAIRTAFEVHDRQVDERIVWAVGEPYQHGDWVALNFSDGIFTTFGNADDERSWAAARAFAASHREPAAQAEAA